MQETHFIIGLNDEDITAEIIKGLTALKLPVMQTMSKS